MTCSEVEDKDTVTQCQAPSEPSSNLSGGRPSSGPWLTVVTESTNATLWDEETAVCVQFGTLCFSSVCEIQSQVHLIINAHLPGGQNLTGVQILILTGPPCSTDEPSYLRSARDRNFQSLMILPSIWGYRTVSIFLNPKIVPWNT